MLPHEDADQAPTTITVEQLEARVAELEARAAETEPDPAPGVSRPRAGRRGKFTRVTRERILGYLAAGATAKLAAQLAHVTPRTLKRWLAQGRAELDALDAWDAAGGNASGKPKPSYTERGRFALDYEAARAGPDLELVSRVQDAARRGEWRAAMALLRARRPGEFAEVQRHQAVAEDEGGELRDVGGELVGKILAVAKRVGSDESG